MSLFQLQKPKDFTLPTNTNVTMETSAFPGNPSQTISKHQDIIPPSKPVEDLIIQPPPFASPASESILETSDEHAVPHTPPPSGGEVQRDAARSILQTVLDTADGKSSHGGSQGNLSVVGNDPLLNMEFMSDVNFSPPSAPVSTVKPLATVATKGSPSLGRSVNKLCECNRSALFNGDADDDYEDDKAGVETIKNHSKDIMAEDRCEKCGRFKSKQSKPSSDEKTNCTEQKDDSAKSLYKKRTLGESKQFASAANLLEKSSQSAIAVKRKTLHKRSQSDAQLSKQGMVIGTHLDFYSEDLEQNENPFILHCKAQGNS